MSTQRVLIGLVFWLGLLVALLSVSAQPPADEKVKQRAEAGDKADALIREGKFADAIEPATTCVRLSKEIDGPKHWRTFDAEQRLKFAETAKGLAADKQKKLLEAITAEERAKKAEVTKAADALERARAALDGYRELLGEETVEVARALHLIGHIALGNNDAKVAKEATEKALNIRRKALPENHPDIASSLNGLGDVQSNLREFEAARKSHIDALAIYRKSLPVNQLDIARTLNSLGYVQSNLREFEASRKSYLEALTIRRKALPESHPDIAQSLNGLGNAQCELREFEAAKKSHTEALAVFRKAVSWDHPEAAEILNGLGNAQCELREFEAARKSYAVALGIQRKTLPEGHPDIAQSLHNMGFLELCSSGTSSPVVDALTEAWTIKRADLTRLASAQAEAEQLTTANALLGTVSLYLSAVTDSGRDPMLAGPRTDDVQWTEPAGRVVGPPARFAVDGDQPRRAGRVGFQGVGNPGPEAPLKRLGLKGDEQSADAIARRDALGEREESGEPTAAIGGPPVNGRWAVAPAHEPAHGNHHDVEEQVLAITGVTRIDEGLEVRADGFDVRQLGRHVPHRVRRAAPRPKRRSGNTVGRPRIKL